MAQRLSGEPSNIKFDTEIPSKEVTTTTILNKTRLDTSSAIQLNDSPMIDAFDRIRVSQPETLFDSKQLFDNQPLFFDDQEVSGTGTTSSHNSNTASSTITVSSNTEGKRVRQTFMRFNYQPGKSQLIFCTGTLSMEGGGTGIKRAMGYFDDNNGLFVQDNEGVLQFVKRSNYTGTPVDIEVNQQDWNLDNLDGNGPSGITLDKTKSQILIIDFEWLGVGRVRMGFVVDGIIHYCHYFKHANNLAGVYMSTPNLPIRYEISNDGTGSESSLEHICSSVISEGGTQKNGVLRHYATPPLTSLSSGTTYVMAAGRLKSTHFGASLDIEKLSCLAQSADQITWELIAGGTVTGTLTYSEFPNSCVEIAPGNKTVTHNGDGIKIDGGYFTQTLPSNNTIPNALRLGSTIDGTAQIFYLTATPITNNASIRASITWRELN